MISFHEFLCNFYAFLPFMQEEIHKSYNIFLWVFFPNKPVKFFIQIISTNLFFVIEDYLN